MMGRRRASVVIQARAYRARRGAVTATFFALALLISGSTTAEDELPHTGESTIDTVHDRLSERVVLTAEWLDSFFADENYRAEANTTSARLTLSSFSQQGEGTDAKAKARLRLRLPNLENRVMLYVGGAGEDFNTSGSIWEDIDNTLTGDDDDNLSVALRRFLRDDERVNTSIGGGARFRDDSVVVYVEPRFRYFRSFPSIDARFIQRFRWYTDVGLESQTDLQFERPIWENWFFRASTRVDWYEDDEGFFPKQGFEWIRPIDERRVMSTSWFSYFSTEPEAELDTSVVGMRYRQQTWRRWLWFEVAPQVAFPSEEDYDPTLGLYLKLEAEFER